MYDTWYRARCMVSYLVPAIMYSSFCCAIMFLLLSSSSFFLEKLVGVPMSSRRRPLLSAALLRDVPDVCRLSFYLPLPLFISSLTFCLFLPSFCCVGCFLVCQGRTRLLLRRLQQRRRRRRLLLPGTRGQRSAERREKPMRPLRYERKTTALS